MGKVLFSLAAILAGTGACVLIGGFLGSIHPIGDSLAVFRVSAAIVAAAGGLLMIGMRGRSLPAFVILVISAAALGTVLPHKIDRPAAAHAETPVLKHYQKNMWYRNGNPLPLAEDILASGADTVTLQEVGARAGPLLEALRNDYPTQILCDSSAIGAVAILSRHPEVAGTRSCLSGSGFVAANVETPVGPVRVASIHLYWPYPLPQAVQVERLLPHLEGAEVPMVIGGDFNMVRWSSVLSRIERTSGTNAVGPARITLRNLRLLLLVSIDHVLAAGGRGTTELRPNLGSDHRGVLASIPFDGPYTKSALIHP